MLRVVLSHLLLFFLPFIGYGVYLWLKNRAQTSENWRQGPMVQLALAGVLLVIASLVFFASYEEAPEGKDYRPSRMENGVFIPGGFD